MPRKSKSKPDLNEHSDKYSKLRGKYDALGGNLVQALEQFLREKDIKVLFVGYRVKDKDSFLEKIERKQYEQPFDECEDLCGVRIICYYQSDEDKITEIISNEFEVLQSQDKEELLEADQFGYRSKHFVVKIKNEWLIAPNYRGLENLKAEIQVRTVLMHAWAEIEHKLAYKKKEHIHEKFKRKLSRISAKLEEADEQFEELKNEVANYKEVVVEVIKSESKDIEDIELNLDSLQAFLDSIFPERSKSEETTSGLVDDFLKYNIGLKEFISSYERVKDYLPQIEEEYFRKSKDRRWAQAGIARVIMSLTNNDFLEEHYSPLDFLIEQRKKWKKIIEENQTKKKTS